ncbi:MAG: AMP-binding protein [Desulfovibrionaceae bacterium]
MAGSVLDAWLAQCCGALPHESLPQCVANFQLHALRATLGWCCERSALYRARLGKNPPVMHCLEDLAHIPFTTVEDVRQWQNLLCVSQSDVLRMVTVQTSGTTGQPKRLAFTARDLQRTCQFFQVGMGQVVQPGQRLLVLLPGAERPNGVADLLRQSLPGVEVRAGSFDTHARALRAALEAYAPHALVATPAQLRCLLTAFTSAPAPPLAGGILSSADPLPCDLGRALAQVFSCLVLDHYGLTESGYGGGVQCHAHDGYHLREADLLVEVVDMHDGSPLPLGQIGEVVITTLGREAMPLLRYRTGDAAALLPGPCTCGSPLKRLGRIQGRLVRHGNTLGIQHLPKGRGGDHYVSVPVHTL